MFAGMGSRYMSGPGPRDIFGPNGPYGLPMGGAGLMGYPGGAPGMAPPMGGPQMMGPPTPPSQPIGWLDWAQMGAGALTDLGNWWETRAERRRREREFEQLRQDDADRRRSMGRSWNAANAALGG